MSKYRLFVTIVLLMIALCLPMWVKEANWLRLLDNMLLYMMLAVGLNLLLGYTGLLNFGYLAFYGIGAYTYALLSSPHFGLFLPSLTIFLIVVLISFCVGVCVGFPAIRLRGDYLAIVTIGFAEIVYIFVNNMNRPFNLTNGPQGITAIMPIHWKNFSFDQDVWIGHCHLTPLTMYYYLFLLVLSCFTIFSYLLEHFPWGRVFRAIRDDEIASLAMGIPVNLYKVMMFAVSAVIAGIAGALFASFQGFVSPASFSLNESFLVLMMVIFGGMGNVAGVLLGSALLVFLPEFFRSGLLLLAAQPFMHHMPVWIQEVLSPEVFRQMLLSLIIFFVVLLRPMGLLPAKGMRLGQGQYD